MAQLKKPLLHKVGILALVYHEWGLPWMTPHHVLTRLAKYFHVVWVNPAHGWREIPERIRQPSSNLVETNVLSGFTVYTPEAWLPQLYRPRSLARYMLAERLRRARSFLTARGCQAIVLDLWHYQFQPALNCFPFDVTCYHIEDEYSFSIQECQTESAEEQLITSVDQVFVVSRGLMEKKGHINPHTTFSPHGVDYDAFSTAVAEPADLSPIPSPRIGYTGVLKKQLDWPLLRGLAMNHPEWSFVFVGPKASHPEISGYIQELSGLRNIHFLGVKSTQELAAYPQHFDACIMPYRIDDYTKYINPLKLHDYLASGRPVVASAIRSLQEFADVITLAQTQYEWSHALKNLVSLGASSIEDVAARREIAKKYDWNEQIRLIARTMCERLGPGYVDQFEKTPLMSP